MNFDSSCQLDPTFWNQFNNRWVRSSTSSTFRQCSTWVAVTWMIWVLNKISINFHPKFPRRWKGCMGSYSTTGGLCWHMLHRGPCDLAATSIQQSKVPTKIIRRWFWNKIPANENSCVCQGQDASQVAWKEMLGGNAGPWIFPLWAIPPCLGSAKEEEPEEAEGESACRSM